VYRNNNINTFCPGARSYYDVCDKSLDNNSLVMLSASNQKRTRFVTDITLKKKNNIDSIEVVKKKDTYL